MTITLLILGIVLAVIVSALSSGMEMGVYCLNRVRLRVRAGQKDPAAQRTLKLMERQEDLVITTLVGTNVADNAASVCMTELFILTMSDPGYAEFLATAVLAPIVLVFGGIIPKDWFQRESDRLMTALVAPLTWARRVVAAFGLIWMLRGLTRRLLRWIDPLHLERERNLIPRTRVTRLLIEGAARGGLTAFQRDTIERVMRLSTVRVADIMVRADRAATVSTDIPRDDLLSIARMAHFSRMPVYRGRGRRAVGIVNVYDVLMDEQERPVAEYVRDAVHMRPEETVPSALFRLQAARQVMGLVVDSRGRFVGLFTMKDLIECVVGQVEAW